MLDSKKSNGAIDGSKVSMAPLSEEVAAFWRVPDPAKRSESCFVYVDSIYSGKVSRL